jgi:hypothetical protein
LAVPRTLIVETVGEVFSLGVILGGSQEVPPMPVLPMIDLLILMGWTSLTLGGVLKAVAITTSYRPEVLTLGPFEFFALSGICLLFALSLAARTWVKANEPEILVKQRRVSTMHSMARESADYRYLEPHRSDSLHGTREPATTDGAGP